MKQLVLLSIALMVGGCASQREAGPRDAQKVDVSKEEAAIRATDAQWAQAVKAKDAERAASFWSNDASIVMPGAPPVQGKDAIRKFVADAFKSPEFSVTWETSKIEVAGSGDLAYQTAHDTVTYRDAKNKLVTEKNNAIVIWKKQADGTWKAQVDMWTPAAAANAAH